MREKLKLVNNMVHQRFVTNSTVQRPPWTVDINLAIQEVLLWNMEFNAMFTNAHYWPYLQSDASSPHLPILFL